MKIDEMVTYLEECGFKVTKTYNSDRKLYIFQIVKDNVSITRNYKFDPNMRLDRVRLMQEEFLDDMKADWHRAWEQHQDMVNQFEIKDVIFNYPATIVLWADGTKTVVKCQADDEFDPEKGLAMAIAKKALGNKGNYCNVIKKYTDTYYKDPSVLLRNSLRIFSDIFRKFAKEE